MPDREIKSIVKLHGVYLDKAAIGRIKREVGESMREELSERVVLGEPKLSCSLTYEELVERRCKDAIRQRGLPRPLRRVPPF